MNLMNGTAWSRCVSCRSSIVVGWCLSVFLVVHWSGCYKFNFSILEFPCPRFSCPKILKFHFRRKSSERRNFCYHFSIFASHLVCKVWTSYAGVNLVWTDRNWKEKIHICHWVLTLSTQQQDSSVELIGQEELWNGHVQVKNALAKRAKQPFFYSIFWIYKLVTYLLPRAFDGKFPFFLLISKSIIPI